MVLRNLLAATFLTLAGAPGAAVSPSIGDVVTDTTFTTAYGQDLKLEDLRGEVVVLTYWMRDCAACDALLSTLDSYYRQRRDLGLRVLAIPVEDLSDRQLKSAFKDKIIHPLAHIRGPFEPVGELPTTYVIGRNGQLRYAAPGPIGLEQLNQILVPLLREPQP